MRSLKEGSWRGRKCFLVGGGESVRSLDRGRLAGELTLGMNMSFLRGTTACLVFDLRLMQELAADPRWAAYAGEKFWLNSEDPAGSYSFPGVTILRECLTSKGLPGWSRSLRHGVYRRTNAGVSALNLAEILGADPIYLLGFDGGGRNWHEEYPEDWRADDAAFGRFVEDFGNVAPALRARVVNLNPESAIRCFEFGDVEEVLRCASPST